jgi:hypothetical protein
MPPTTVSATVVPLAVVPAAPALENQNEIYAIICSQIIKEQQQIIGALAVEQATHVPGLRVDPATYQCAIAGDGAAIVEELINHYRDFFGNAAVEVCKEAAARFLSRLPENSMPHSLRQDLNR